MTAGRPTGALGQAISVIGIADKDSSAGLLLLEVTFQTECRVAFGQHPRVDRSVRRVAAHATFFQRFVLKHEWSGLRHMTLETGFVLAKQQSPAAFYCLRQTGPAAFDRAADVRIVAIGATHLAFQDRMVMWHLKSRAHFEVTLEAGVRRSPRIDDLGLIATG